MVYIIKTRKKKDKAVLLNISSLGYTHTLYLYTLKNNI